MRQGGRLTRAIPSAYASHGGGRLGLVPSPHYDPWSGEAMFEDLLRLYEKAQVNTGEPKSIFGETFLFNEGWLLAGVLSLWQRGEKPSALPFLPFPKDSLVRAPVQLYTSFRKTKRSEALGETNTRADGVAGHFQKNK